MMASFSHPIDSTFAKYLIPALIGGLGAGSVGALAASRNKERPGETPEERRTRIIRNALGMGLGGAGVGAAISGIAQNLPSMGPDRTIWEGMTGGMADDLGARAVGGIVGGAGLGAAGVGQGMMKNVKMKADGLRDVAALRGVGHVDKAIALERDLATSLRDRLVRRAKGLGGLGAVLGLIAPEVASLSDSTMGSVVGGTVGAGVGGLAGGGSKPLLDMVAKRPVSLSNLKKPGIGMLTGALAGAYLPRAKLTHVPFTDG